MFRFVCRAAPLDAASCTRHWLARLAAVCVAAGALVACTEAVRLGRDLGVAGAPTSLPEAGSSGNAAGPSPTFPVDGVGGSNADAGNLPAPLVDAGPCTPAPCGGVEYECGNCSDDDGDGESDALDPECLGPCDDSEGELFNGTTTNVNGSCRADCYFDRNTGSGDDGCSWSYRCDPRSVAPDFYPTGNVMCEHDPSLATCSPDPSELAGCETGCLPLTPNGCDCFGCCELPARSGNFIWLGSTNEQSHCELATSADPNACRPCTPVPDCQNPCEECELCVGSPSLPGSCSVAPRCPDGARACDPRTQLGCGSVEYCITGCCVQLPQ
jgi:hypothetical protein